MRPILKLQGAAQQRPSTDAAALRRAKSYLVNLAGSAVRWRAAPPSALGRARPGTPVLWHAGEVGAAHRRQSIQPQQPRHRRRAPTPRTPQAQHQGAHRGQRMAVDGPQIDRPACPAARTEDIQPRRPRDRCGAYGGRPQPRPMTRRDVRSRNSSRSNDKCTVI
jgi:hypothetical protein